MGERGSPCLRPFWWKKPAPGSPLTSTWVEEVDRIRHKRLHHCCPKPRWCRTTRRKGHETESKALEMSSLSFTSSGMMMGQNLDCWDYITFLVYWDTETFGGLLVLLSSDYKFGLVTCADIVHYGYLVIICLCCVMSSPNFSHGYQNLECQFSIVDMQFVTVSCQWVCYGVASV